MITHSNLCYIVLSLASWIYTLSRVSRVTSTNGHHSSPPSKLVPDCGGNEQNSPRIRNRLSLYDGPEAKKVLPLVALIPGSEVELKRQNAGIYSIKALSDDDIRTVVHESNWNSSKSGNINYVYRGEGPFGSLGVNKDSLNKHEDHSPCHHQIDDPRECHAGENTAETPKIAESDENLHKNTELKRIKSHIRRTLIPSLHLRHVLYAARIGVGTPPQFVRPIFDTGSTNTWVVSNICRSESCHSVRKFDHKRSSTFRLLRSDSPDDKIEIRFGTGSIVGTPAIENFTIGGDVVKDQVFGIVEQEIPDDENVDIFEMVNFEGIVGLGLPKMAWNSYSSLYDNYSNEINAEKIFSLYFSNSTYSAVIFGGVDKRFFTGDIRMIPVVRELYWEVNLLEVWVGEYKLCCEKKSYCIFDSGTSFNTFPHEAFMHFEKIVPHGDHGSHDPDSILDQFPTIKYVFEGHVSATIEPEQYVFMAKNSYKPAYMQMDVPSSHGQAYILGNMAFMQHYYTVFRRETETSPAMIGFAPSLHSQENQEFLDRLHSY